MKISYVLQLKDFGIMLLIGIIIGVLYGLINIITTLKRNIILQIISDLFFTIFTSFVFIICINFINLGEFRAFLLIGYLAGIIIERITLGKIFAKGYKLMYTNIVKLLKRFAKTKLGRTILK